MYVHRNLTQLWSYCSKLKYIYIYIYTEYIYIYRIYIYIYRIYIYIYTEYIYIYIYRIYIYIQNRALKVVLLIFEAKILLLYQIVCFFSSFLVITNVIHGCFLLHKAEKDFWHFQVFIFCYRAYSKTGTAENFDKLIF